MDEGDDQFENFEEEEYDEEGQVKKPGKKKKELSDYEKMKIKQTIEEMIRIKFNHRKSLEKKISINQVLYLILQK